MASLYPRYLYERPPYRVNDFHSLLRALHRRSNDPEYHLKTISWKDKANPLGIDRLRWVDLSDDVILLTSALRGHWHINRPFHPLEHGPLCHPVPPLELVPGSLPGLETMQEEAVILSNDIEMNHLRLSRGDPRGTDEPSLFMRRQNFHHKWTPWLRYMRGSIEDWWRSERRKMGGRL